MCGVVWCGVVWCGVVWCGVVWCGVVWQEIFISYHILLPKPMQVQQTHQTTPGASSHVTDRRISNPTLVTLGSHRPPVSSPMVGRGRISGVRRVRIERRGMGAM